MNFNFNKFKFKLDFSRRNITKGVFIFLISLFFLIVYNFGSQNLFGLSALITTEREDAQNVANTQSFLLEGIEEINVDWKYGDIEVSLIAGTEIVITEMIGEELLSSDKMYVQDKYGTIDIDWCEKPSSTSLQTEKKLIISIPTESTIEKIDINSESGDVLYKDLLGMSANLSSYDGNVTLQNSSGEKFQIDSYSGDIAVSAVQTESITTKTNYGKLTAEQVTSDSIYARTGQEDVFVSGSFESSSVSSINGDVEFVNTGAIKDLSAYSIFGDVNLSVAENEGFWFEESTVYGESSVEGFEFEESEEGRYYKSDLFESKIKISSTQGNVSLAKIA